MSLLNHAELTDADDGDDERRIAPRLKTLKRGKVMFNNMSSTFDCIVRNISATGALLTLDEQAHLPREFDIRIGEEKAVRPARLVYRRGMLAGIHFRDAVGDETSAEAAKPAAPNPQPAAKPAREEGGIRRIRGEHLPEAVVSRFRWF